MFGRYWTGSCCKNQRGRMAGLSDPWAATTGVSVCGSDVQWNCSALLQTLSHARTPTTPWMGVAVTLRPILAPWDRDMDGGTRFNVPRVWTARPGNVEGTLRTQVTRELPQLCCPSSFCLGDFLQWRWSEHWQSLG
jgi:hypothetical protein